MSYRDEIKEYIRQESVQERKKLKEMSWGDRFWYIWEYYKWHMLIGVFIFLMLCVVGTSIYNSTLDTKLYCAVINNPTLYQENLQALTDQFSAHMQYGKKDIVSVESLHLSTDGTIDEISIANQAKMSALIASESLDAIISDEEVFQEYIEIDGFQNLDNLLPDDLKELLQDRLIYAKDSSGQTFPFGVDVTGCRLLQDMGVATDPACFAVIINSKHADTCMELLRFMFTNP